MLPADDRHRGDGDATADLLVSVLAVSRRLMVLPLTMLIAACGSAGDDAQRASSPTSTAISTATSTATAAPAADPDLVPTFVEPDVAPITSTTAELPTTTIEEPLVGAELVGRWALYDVVAYEDGVLKTLIISYGFNDFTEIDGQIFDNAQFCFSEQRTDEPIETSLSDAATQAIRPPPTPVAVDLDGDVLRIRRAATPTPVGIRLDDPANESLPTDPDDPRIVDDDGDGQPGITVSIRVSDDLSGELYIARREVFAYEAVLTEPDRLEGVVTDNSEQLVIGVSDPIFATSPGTGPSTPT